jgi:hypothetical protein
MQRWSWFFAETEREYAALKEKILDHIQLVYSD